MRKNFKVLSIGSLTSFLIAFGVFTYSKDSISESSSVVVEKAEMPSGDLIAVDRVVDGDTIKVTFEGKSESVRIIGINTPETKHPTKPIECFGPEASKFDVK